jgi:hypothetical protein
LKTSQYDIRRLVLDDVEDNIAHRVRGYLYCQTLEMIGTEIHGRTVRDVWHVVQRRTMPVAAAVVPEDVNRTIAAGGRQ